MSPPKCLNPIFRDREFYHLSTIEVFTSIITICMHLVLYRLLWEKRIELSKTKYIFTLWLLLSQQWGLNPWSKGHETNNFGRKLHWSHTSNQAFSFFNTLGSREEDLAFCLHLWFLPWDPGVGKVIKFTIKIPFALNKKWWRFSIS